MNSRRTVAVKICVYLTALALLSLSSGLLYAGPDELEQIRNAIKEKGAKWHADKTSMTGLTKREKKMHMGGKEDEDLMPEYLSSLSATSIPDIQGAPTTVDWRNVGGVNYVSPVKNQGSCGSCWAFATTAGLESQVMINSGGGPVDISEQTLVSCSGSGSCSGGSSAGASSFIRDTGLPLESCFTYTGTNSLCSNACAGWQNSAYRISGWHSAGTTTVDAIRNAVYAYGPVVATMYVHNDFFSYRSGVYSYTSGSYVGAHAVLVVGYDDLQQAFIVKNSWGSGWGEAGFFMIAYSEVSGMSGFGYSTMVYDGYGAEPDPDPDPAPTCTYSLSSNGASFKAAGGSSGFTLNASGVCSLSSVTPASGASWVAITSATNGASSTTVNYTVSSNSGSERSTTIGIAGLKYTVKQAGVRTSGKRR